MGQAKISGPKLAGKTVNAFSGCQHQHGRRPIDSIASANLLGTLAQYIPRLFGGGPVLNLHDREDGPDREVDIKVG